MKLQKIQEFLSVPRFERYLNACGGDKQKTLELYKLNLKLAKAFHPVVGTFEVILRNKLDFEFAKGFGEINWAILSRNKLPKFMKDEILKAENRLKKRGGIITHHKLMSDQNFGFWTESFEKNSFGVLKGSPIYCFRFRPKGVNRDNLNLKLNAVRRFRNRINHNDPICFKGAKVDFSDAKTTYQHLCDLLEWIDPETRILMKGIDEVERLLKQILIKYP
jgi:hypothetical protein